MRRVVPALCLILLTLVPLGAPGAHGAPVPPSVRVVNLFDTSATIIWDSTSAEAGSVNLGTSCASLAPGGTDTTQAHAITLYPLLATTTYFYTVTSGGQTYPAGGCLQFTTHASNSVLTAAPLVAYGRVMSGAGCTTPVTSGVVTVTVTGAGGSSLPTSAVINDTASGIPGTYVVNIAPAASSSGTSYYTPAANDTITVSGDNGFATGARQVKYDGTSTQVSVPDVCVVINPTVVRYERLSVHRLHGVTHLRWYASTRGLGFNVFDGGSKLNRTPVTSRTRWFTFSTPQVVHHLRLVPVRSHRIR